jgi:rubredoxin
MRMPEMARFACPECGFVYDEGEGMVREGFPPGTKWAQVPDNWACPDCAVRDKVDFVPTGQENSDERRNRA